MFKKKRTLTVHKHPLVSVTPSVSRLCVCCQNQVGYLWECVACKFNICNTCADFVSKIPQHPHALVHSPPTYPSGWRCDSCKMSFENTLESWNCSKCQFDLCDKCYGFTKGEIFKPPNRLESVHRHPLTKQKPKYSSGFWVCDECSTDASVKVKAWNCEICQFDLCDACYQKALSSPPPMAQGKEKGFVSWSDLKFAYIKILTTSNLPLPKPLWEITVDYLNWKASKWSTGDLCDVRHQGEWKEGRISDLSITPETGYMVNISVEASGRPSRISLWSSTDRVSLSSESKDIARRGTHTIDRMLYSMECRMLFPSSGRVGFDKITLDREIDSSLYTVWNDLAQKYAVANPSTKKKKDTTPTKESDEMRLKREEDERVTFLMAMLKQESSLRLAPYAQHEMDKYRHSERMVTQYTEGIQSQVVRDFGFDTDELEPLGLRLLRSAPNMYPDHSVVKDTFYVKFNRCVPGNLVAGSECPDLPMVDLEGKSISLFSFYHQLAKQQCGYEAKSDAAAPPMVLIAGSST